LHMPDGEDAVDEDDDEATISIDCIPPLMVTGAYLCILFVSEFGFACVRWVRICMSLFRDARTGRRRRRACQKVRCCQVDGDVGVCAKGMSLYLCV
jgi:hypothetical protein